MTQDSTEGQSFAALQRSLRRMRFGLAITMLVLLASLGWQVVRHSMASKEVRTHRLVVVDDKGVKRVDIGQDAAAWRRSRSAGVLIFDGTGHERGGMSTFEDGSVAIGLDAPVGVGKQPRDRMGMRVDPDGSAWLLLTGNDTGGVVRLLSDGKGGGGVQLIRGDMSKRQIHVHTLGFDGEMHETVPME